jgi:hypothetical protein
VATLSHRIIALDRQDVTRTRILLQTIERAGAQE